MKYTAKLIRQVHYIYCIDIHLGEWFILSKDLMITKHTLVQKQSILHITLTFNMTFIFSEY